MNNTRRPVGTFGDAVIAALAAVFIGLTLAAFIISAQEVRAAPAYSVTYAAPAGTQADADAVAEFCGMFVEHVADAVITARANGVPRSAWSVNNGPDYVVTPLNAMIDALYASDNTAAVEHYRASVLGCIKYKTTTTI